MCGIVGIWQDNNKLIDREVLVRMRDRLACRGPDDAGIWLNNNIGFGHRRLSILDISQLGHQPMVDQETGNVITFNGEVYNFREIRTQLEAKGIAIKSRTDTEVVLKAYRLWGKQCLKRFNGMFAFAIWDNEAKGLFVARDRMGIKPLYYYMDSAVFLFASRLRALLAHPACCRNVNPQAVALYLEAGYVPAPWSILQGVYKLQCGHHLWINENGMKVQSYWKIDNITLDNSLKKADDNELEERLDNLLRDAVKQRLVSDVPLGAFLSGGVDSSIVVAMMSRYSRSRPKTFTIGFKEKAYSETHYARKIAGLLGADHHEQIMGESDLLSLLDENAEHYDEPFADWSSLPTMLVSQFARKHVTVCLSGDGGDELFGGYHYYGILSSLRRLYCLPVAVRVLVGKILRSISSHRCALLGHSLCQANLMDAFTFMRSMIKDYSRTTLIDDDLLPSLAELFKQRSEGFAPIDTISQACRLDACYYLSDDILQKVDVASMSVALEARVPILDHRVVEFSQSLPLRFKRRRGKSKWLLRKVLSRYLPTELFERPKSGFEVPIREWFRDELKEMIQDELSMTRIKHLGYLKPKGVQRLLNLHLSGKRDTHPMLWALLSLVRWHENIEQKQPDNRIYNDLSLSNERFS